MGHQVENQILIYSARLPMLAVAFCLILPQISGWNVLPYMPGAKQTPSSNKLSKIPESALSTSPKATSANWLPGFQLLRPTRKEKSNLPGGSNVPPKQRSFSLSKHAEKTGICRTSRGYRSRWCRTYSTSHSLPKRQDNMG